ncbi:MAG: TIGR01777 family oxidoreductase [Thermoanaerobaculia bacterium]
MTRIVISGGSGFIGEALARVLAGRGDDVSILTRTPSSVKAGKPVLWNPTEPAAWMESVRSADVVINLAGENVGAGRWTEKRKQAILQSRETVTGALVDVMLTAPRSDRVFISASAIGFYGDRGDESIDEESASGGGFLAEVTTRWEEIARRADKAARVVLMRFGIVLGSEGGALAKMALPFRLGAGGPMGSGKQWMSWVDRQDLLRMVVWAIDHPEVRGVYNVTAPNPVTNAQFSSALGRALHRPAILPAPAFALRLVLGQMADEMLLGGQRVLPTRATEQGFRFEYPTVDASLSHIYP